MQRRSWRRSNWNAARHCMGCRRCSSALQHPDFGRFNVSTLRTGIMAGSPCPIEVMRRVIGEMGMHEITIGYGMTETSPLSFQSRPEDSIERRVSTVGRIHPHVYVKIVDKQ